MNYNGLKKEVVFNKDLGIKQWEIIKGLRVFFHHIKDNSIIKNVKLVI